MIVEHGKIIKATEMELFDKWLKGFDEIVDFETYKRACRYNGTTITEDGNNDTEDTCLCRPDDSDRTCRHDDRNVLSDKRGGDE